jgi:predicted O-methyltransferase YrrM
MSQELWSAVDAYVGETLVGDDPALVRALAASVEAGLPAIAVSPPQGKFLNMLARVHGARRVLELGTLGGYSTIWLARALPDDGSLVTLELEAHYAEVARANVEAAGVGDRVELRVGPAGDGLRVLIAEGAEPFDLIFIDADKASTPEYFTLGIQLTRPGGLIVADNVVRNGTLIDPRDDPGSAGMKQFHEMLAVDARVTATTIQTVGSKGYDGFTLVLVESV